MSTDPVKILLIEDNPGDARLLSEMLAADSLVAFQLTHAPCLSAALPHLEEIRFAVILLDLFLPDSQGFETFTRVQAKAPGVPIVVLSGFEDEKLALRAVREGAQDYLVKGQVNDSSLVHAIRYAIERHQTNFESLPQPRRQPGKVLGFVGAKGGVGTTTIALNVAAALSRRGKCVIAVELRPYPGTFSSLVKRAPIESLADVMKIDPGAINERRLRYQLVNYSAALEILFGPQEIDKYQELDPEWVQALILELAGMADYVVLDLPCSPSRANEVAVRCCDRVGLVMECDLSCVLFSKPTVQLLRNWRAGASLGGEPARSPLIRSRADSARTDSCDALGAVVVNRADLPVPPKAPQIRELLDCEVLGVVPPASEALRSAQNARVLFVLGHHDHACAVAMTELADRLDVDHPISVASDQKPLGSSWADACVSGVAVPS